MKIVLTTLNAKFIHTSLALRWLYVANKDRFDISFKEFIIKEDIGTLTQQLLATQPDVIGISVSIWNVKQSKALIEQLKSAKPELIIFIGGPEVMYEPEFFIENWEIDYVVSGEGEFVTGELLQALEQGLRNVEIPGVSYKDHINRTIVQADIDKLVELDSPYQLPEDRDSLKHRVVYFETSRGCPYQCRYCLSSLEKGVRYFPKNYIEENLAYFINSPAKLIKFLDRTFNLNRKHTDHVFSYLIEHHRPNLSCQFEIYADLLKDENIEYLNTQLPNDYFRFEIGIQSTYEPTNKEINRLQDFELLAGNIRKLMTGGKIDLHLDLIAGLPFETFERFVKSFNDVFALGAKEVQLGFLKMLRGTSLRNNANKYGYSFQEEAPYEIYYNDDISVDQIERIHCAEEALDRYWNSGRFGRSMNYLMDGPFKGQYFEFFEAMHTFYTEANLPRLGYQLEDLFRLLQEFIQAQGIDIFELLRADYYDNYTLRPHGFWEEKTCKKQKKAWLQEILYDNEFFSKNNITKDQIEKYATLDLIDTNTLLVTLFNCRKSKLEPHPTLYYQLKKE